MEKLTIIKNKNFPNERDLYGADRIVLENCTFQGKEDGESALKEAKNITLKDCYMDLRYPLWHDDNVVLDNVTMTENCRAALWYTNRLTAKNCDMSGIKALRECRVADICGGRIISPEFGWKSENVSLTDIQVVSEYLFLLAKNLRLQKVDFKGKYSFQYVENALIENCVLDTKDAFWHSKNVTVKNSVVKGEYLAWYSENLTLINCKIIGTQPLCYCKGLKLINCTMEGTDFSFEYSDVEATIAGSILSVKNPRSGSITADKIEELIYTDDSKYPCDCVVTVRK